jgi:4-amino-4-deoxy-L-arabinose transferase-like glycosyltransferase
LIRAVASLVVEFGVEEVLGTRFDYVPDRYDVLARNLFEHGTFGFDPDVATAARGPLYPVLIGGIQFLFGERLLWLRFVMSLADSASCVLLVLIAGRLGMGQRAVFVGGLYAVYPFGIWAVLRLWNDPLIVLCTLALVLLLLKHLDAPSLKTSAYLGLLLGVALYAKELFAPVPVVVMVATFFLRREIPRSRWIVYGGLTLLLMIVVVAPWTYRNHLVFDRFVLVQSLGGFNYWVGQYWFEKAKTGRPAGTYTEIAEEAIEEGYKLLDRNGVDSSRLYEPDGDAFFKEHMFASFVNSQRRIVEKLVFFLPKFWYVMDTPDKERVGYLINGPLYLLALVGLAWVVVKRDSMSLRGYALLLATILYFNLFHSVIVSVFRYALPVMPLVIVFAAEGVSVVNRMLMRRTPEQRSG